QIATDAELQPSIGRRFDRRARELTVAFGHVRIADEEECALALDGVVHRRARTEPPVVDVPAELPRRNAVHLAALGRRDAHYSEMRAQRNEDALERGRPLRLLRRDDRPGRVVARAVRVVEGEYGMRETARRVDAVDGDPFLAHPLVQVAPPRPDVRPVLTAR